MKINSINNNKFNQIVPFLLSVLLGMVFFANNAYAFTVACPSGFAPGVVCSCEGGDLQVTSGGSTSNFGANAICEVDATGFLQEQALQTAIINAGNRNVGGRSSAFLTDAEIISLSFFGSVPGRPDISPRSEYKPSELPEWDFLANVQSNVGSSEISLSSAPDRKSDFHSVAVNLGARKDALSIGGQFRYRSINGRGVNNGQDTMQYGLMLSSDYQVLKQAEQGINFGVFSFIDISANDNKNLDDQTRLASGAGFNVSRLTSLGLFNLGYIFTHDRNLDNDTELTGDQYFNIHQVSFDHSIKLLDTLILITRLSHMHLPDLPDAIEDNGSKAGFGFSYIGFKNVILKAGYDKSFDGYGHQSGNFSVAYRW